MTRRRILVAFSLGASVMAAFVLHWLTGRPMTYAAHTPADSLLAEPAEAPLELADAGPADAGAPLHAARRGRSADSEAFRPERPVERVATPILAQAQAYLLVGVDHTRGRWGRADSILVAFFDDESGHVGVVSIPRDLLVEVPGHGPARINATLRIAVRTRADPLAVMRGVVRDVLDAPIEHVLVGDLEAFERSIDGLGGIVVDVPCSIRDRFHDARVEGERRTLDVEAGARRMDGVTAAMYVRSRHGRSDWDRARRQQAVLAGLRDRLRELGPAGWLPVVGPAMESGVYTTMSRFELLGLARRVAEVGPERMHGLLIGTKETEPARTVEGRYVLEPDFAAIDVALAGLFDAPSPGLRPERKRCLAPDVALRR